MIPKPLSQVDKDDIERLVTDEVREGRQIECKLSLPTGKDDDRREFLADVSSFANASGGDLIYGVPDKRDSSGQPTGIPDAPVGLPDLNLDKVRLGLLASIRSGISPRIMGVDVHAVEGFPQGPVLVVRAPKSFAAPHMVTFKGSSRFFGRSSAGKQQLDVTEIRAAFEMSGSQADRIREFRADRVARVLADDTPVPLTNGAKAMMLLYPLAALDRGHQVDLSGLHRNLHEARLLGASIHNVRFNFDGLLGYNVSNEGEGRGYVQVYRSGIVEVVSRGLFNDTFRSDAPKSLPSGAFEEYIVKAMDGYLKAMKAAGAVLPITAMLSLVEVKGYFMYVDPLYEDERHVIDRDVLDFADIFNDEWEPNVGRMLRPWLDAIWQATGRAGSPNYDEDGNWVRPPR